jgi:hypothetical protein
METITKNKNHKKANLGVALKAAGGQRHKGIVQKQAEQKLVPGKSLEQIRVEAVRQLREMGILI